MQKIELREDIKKLMKNAEFVKEVIASESADEAIEVFESKGVSITLDELGAVYDLIDKVLIYAQGGELSENELENVSGGFALSTATVCALVALCGTDIGLRIARRARNSKANFKDLQAKALDVGAAAHVAHSNKEADRHETDNYIVAGVGAASISAALLILNYYKDDINKYWRSRKRQMKKSINAGKGKA